MTHKMPELPYAKDALEPHISRETIEYHYGKHLQAYVDNLNKLIPGTEYEDVSLEEIIRRAEGPIFNNGAQVWNHTFYFNTFSPKPQEKPEGKAGMRWRRNTVLSIISRPNSRRRLPDCSGRVGHGW